MLTEVEFCTLHCKVELWPAVILAGVAVKLAITGSAPTVTATLQEALVPPPVAVMM